MERLVGINGFGRIGRAIFRILLQKKYFDILVINEINPDNKNIAYQLQYDSLYGKLDDKISADAESITVNGKKIYVYHEKSIDDVPWEKHNVSRVIDSSGVFDNVIRSRNLRDKGVKQAIITHSPDEKALDKSIIMGVNEHDLDVKKDMVISSSICDSVAFAPVAKALLDNYGIDHGFLTTLHPWLQYQNLLDGPSISWSMPGHTDSHYILGRASTFSLMPKPTSTVTAACKVLKALDHKFHSFSYRVPTATVSSSDISVKLNKKVTKEEVVEMFKRMEQKQKLKIFYNNFDPLVSIDFKGMEHSAIIDHRWTTINDGNYLKLILWYDNEWGYSCRVVDMVNYIFDKDKR